MLIFLFALASILPEEALSGGIAQPDRPYNILWQPPSAICAQHWSIYFPLVDYKFAINPRNRLQGASNAIWYDFGSFPYNDFVSSRFNNGGVPQNGDLKKHLVEALHDIGKNEYIPVCDERFDSCTDDQCQGSWLCIEGENPEPTMVQHEVGECMSNGTYVCGYGADCTPIDKSVCAPIDSTFTTYSTINMEWWRPGYDTLWSSEHQEYTMMSEDLVRKDVEFMNPKDSEGNALPIPDDDDIAAEGARRFEEGARSFLTSSLKLGRTLRPNTKWGFYHYPFCYNEGNYVGFFCTREAENFNNNLWYLWVETTNFLPSVYMYREFSPTELFRFHFGQYCEAIRVSFLNTTIDWRADLAANKSIEWRTITPYLTYKYNMTVPPPLYKKDDLFVTLRFGAEFGFEASILWGASQDFDDFTDSSGKIYNTLCNFMKDYTLSTIGPQSKMIIEWAETCSSVRCSKHGRCAHIAALCNNSTTAEQLSASINLKDAQGQYILRTDSSYLNANYFCKCYSGYRGQRCELQ